MVHTDLLLNEGSPLTGMIELRPRLSQTKRKRGVHDGAMASKHTATELGPFVHIQTYSDGLQPKSDGLQPTTFPGLLWFTSNPSK